MGISNVLCQALQQQSHDILNAMCIIFTSKSLLQQLRDGGQYNLLENVKEFYRNMRLRSLIWVHDTS